MRSNRLEFTWVLGVNKNKASHLVWGLFATKPTPVKQKRDGIHINRLAVAVGVHQLLQLRGPLDAEEHLVAILQRK